MPKRILDDSLLDSRSLEVLSPRAQDAFPRFILLADDFGCFEVNPRVLWAKGWSRRSDVSEQDVDAWIQECAERQAVDPENGQRMPPVVMLWTHAGRRYAHLTGWFGPHGQKKRAEYNPNAPAGTPGRHGSKRKTPPPPADLLAEVMAGNVRAVDGKPPGTDRDPAGNTDDGNLNDFTPAREVTGSQPGNELDGAGKGTVPAPAVPVAVPVAVAAGEPWRPLTAAVDDLPSRKLVVEDYADSPPPEPEVVQFQRALEQRMARTAPFPGGNREVLDQLRAALAVIPLAEAVEVVYRRDVDGARTGSRVKTLRLVAAVLADEVSARRSLAAARPKTRRAIGVDDNGQPVFSEAT